jgi:hypothetical protein
VRRGIEAGHLVPCWFQRTPIKDDASERNPELLRVIPWDYVVLRSVGGRLGLLAKQLRAMGSLAHGVA